MCFSRSFPGRCIALPNMSVCVCNSYLSYFLTQSSTHGQQEIKCVFSQLCDCGLTRHWLSRTPVPLSNVPVMLVIYGYMYILRFTWHACHLQSLCGMMIDQCFSLWYFSPNEADVGRTGYFEYKLPELDIVLLVSVSFDLIYLLPLFLLTLPAHFPRGFIIMIIILLNFIT